MCCKIASWLLHRCESRCKYKHFAWSTQRCTGRCAMHTQHYFKQRTCYNVYLLQVREYAVAVRVRAEQENTSLCKLFLHVSPLLAATQCSSRSRSGRMKRPRNLVTAGPTPRNLESMSAVVFKLDASFCTTV